MGDSFVISRSHIVRYISAVYLRGIAKGEISFQRDMARVCISREGKATRKGGSIGKNALTAARFQAHCYKHSSHGLAPVIISLRLISRLFLGLFYSPSPNDLADTRISSTNRPSSRNAIRDPLETEFSLCDFATVLREICFSIRFH